MKKYQITIDNISSIINESIKKILSERMHVVNDKMFKLSEEIYNIIVSNFKKEKYEFDFTLNSEFLKKYYPYKNPMDLKISVGFDNTVGTAQYLKNKTILVNVSRFFNDDENSRLSKIFHELTHYVNDCEGGIKDVFLCDNKIINDLVYLLRDTECNARCSEFGYFLSKERKNKPIEKYENITKLNKILEKINELKKSNYGGKKIHSVLQKFERYKQNIFNIYYSKLNGGI